ncbi:amino acid adenylation domain-containing protein, partial [Candidatus Trichorickettsia mobilis]|uniref:amino acid adenylation domain-containing protein n=1 Tax=Candidatus Trichorickettsia mobilis TaxID=1346319 RepID=UPI002B25C430
MLEKIDKLYSLIFNGFKFELDNGNLDVLVPKKVSDHYRIFAREFVSNNKDFIVSALSNINSNILHFNCGNCLIPLSFAQERLNFIDKYEGGTNAYNISLVFTLSVNDELVLKSLKQSINDIVERHEILRSIIREDSQGNGCQLVMQLDEYPLNISLVKVRSQEELSQEISKSVNHVYNLSSEYPIKVNLYEQDLIDKKYYLSIVIHHIAFDGWSINVLLAELAELYQYHYKIAQGEKKVTLELLPLNIQYRDFTLWQKNYLKEERLEKQLNYWKNKLIDYETLCLVTDKPRPIEFDYKGEDIFFEIKANVSRELRQLAKDLEVSLYSLLLAGYCLLLKVYSNQNDIIVGIPVANRHYDKVENLIGFFVNSLLLRIKIDDTLSIKEYIRKVSRELIEAQLYQDLPFEKLVEELKVDKDTNRHPIFQVMFGTQQFEIKINDQSKLEQDKNSSLASILSKYEEDYGYKIAKFDLSTFIDDNGEKLKGSFNYATSLYSKATIKGFIETYQNILVQFGELVDNSQDRIKINEINYLSKQQYKLIVEEWNKTERDCLEDKTIHQLFEEQVIKTPDNIALVYENIKLTYSELNSRVNKLANYLRQHKIGSGTLVALCLDRNENMLISILGILKAGGSYVPIDPNYPDQRIKYIVQDINIANRARRIIKTLVIVNERYKKRLKRIVDDIEVLSIDSQILQEQLLSESEANPVPMGKSNSLAYVIYTSGTTGNSKGVMIEHGGVINTILSLQSVYNFAKGNAVTAFTSYVFDVSVSEFFIALFNGGVLHLLSEKLRTNVVSISKYIIRNNINYLYLPPVLLSNLPRVQYKDLYGIIYAGEPCDRDTAKYWSSHHKLYNYYGPTETTIYASGKQIICEDVNLIGSPIYNVKIYVLDNNLNLLPIGGVGEIYIGGVGLARGYVNRADLTAERFIANPFGNGERLYKTGDIGRYLHDGNIEYLGRSDEQ